MTRRIHWGITALIILVIAAGGFMYWQWSQVQQLKEQLAQDEKMLEESNKQQTNQPAGVNKFNTRPGDIAMQNWRNKPNDGNEYVWHGDHWHRVSDPDRPRLEDMDFSSVKSSVDDFFKSDLPDELPAKFPTDEEIQQMSYADLSHLIKLYRKAALDLEKTDYEAGIRLYNRTSKLVQRKRELSEEISKRVMAEHEAFVKTLPIRRSQTEESPAVIIEVGPSPNDGGK